MYSEQAEGTTESNSLQAFGVKASLTVKELEAPN